MRMRRILLCMNLFSGFHTISLFTSLECWVLRGLEQGGLPEFTKDFDGAEAFLAVASGQKIRTSRSSRSRLGGRRHRRTQ